ncbi:uncharacterized protein TRIADDRAFT_28268, partial [Trichoplax adhaerens]
WACARPSSLPVKNRNKHITDILEILQKKYENLGDQWRVKGYTKAISSIKNYPREITTREEAEAIPNIGKRLADKIWEIISCGHLRKLDYMDNDVQTALNVFTKIWGAGPATAHNWIAQGLYTLDDIRAKAKLNYHQSIGLKYYDDFNERIPRAEVVEIEAVIREEATAIELGLEVITCGSYRREKPTCGDVDILISHPNGRSHQGVYHKLLRRLQAKDFLTEILVNQDVDIDHQKLLGVCKLPEEGRKYRRLDIIVVPYREWACSLLYFTGSGHFNRSMRLLARKKRMHLSEHAISVGVLRKVTACSGNQKLTRGTPVPTKCEADIFALLGLDYLEPKDRDC